MIEGGRYGKESHEGNEVTSRTCSISGEVENTRILSLSFRRRGCGTIKLGGYF